MQKTYSISIYLDTRRAKANGLYPVKLRLFSSSPRKQMLYATAFDMSEREFDKIWNTIKPRNEHKDIRRKLQEIETLAVNIANELQPFSKEQFEKRLYRKAGDGIRVSYHYRLQIEEFKKRDQIGTASSYELSAKSLKNFCEEHKKQNYDKLTFQEINANWLHDYEQYMTGTKGNRPTTVGVYLRALKAIFNRAIAEKEIDAETYPFGKRKYQIPATRRVKKALSRDQLRTLFQTIPATPEQDKAKDFWFFSYACNGMNMKDIAELRQKDIQGGKFDFVRAKTKLTTKSQQKPITVFLNDFSRGIIEKYRNTSDGNDFLFPILETNDSSLVQRRKVQNFTRFVNQHMKKLCISNDLPSDVSTYWARHSFVTNAVRNGASIEFIKESVGHKDLKTTQVYFEGFDSDIRKEFSERLFEELV